MGCVASCFVLVAWSRSQTPCDPPDLLGTFAMAVVVLHGTDIVWLFRFQGGCPQPKFVSFLLISCALACGSLSFLVCALSPFVPDLVPRVPCNIAGNLSRGVGVMGRMNIPSPKEKGPANWLGLLVRFATSKRILTRVGVIASSIALRELLRWLLHMIRNDWW
jgi:hypothetical protein